MSDLKGPRQSSFGRRRSSPLQKLTFFDRYYRSLHHIVVLVGVSAFFGPFVYRYFNSPRLEDVKFSPGAPRPDYAAIEKALDKWR